MVNRAELEIREIRSLLRNPTPENFELVNRKMELLASYLTSLKETLSAGQACDFTARKFLMRLPFEMSAMRVLMQGPLEFFRGVNALRAAKFGSYERTGALRNFQLDISSKTLIRL